MAPVTFKVVALSGLAFLAPATGQKACEAEVCAQDSDEAPLLQVAARASARFGSVEEEADAASLTRNSTKSCRWGIPVKKASQCVPKVATTLATKYHVNSVGWWNLPEQPQGPSKSDKLTPFDDFANYSDVMDGNLSTFLEKAEFSTAAAEDAVHLMFEATKVEGLFEHVPEPLRGVFWMKGNGMAEELTVLQFGRNFENAETYVQGIGPFSWAWADGKPKNAPFHGAMYYPGSAANAAAYMCAFPGAVSYKFSSCPAQSWSAKCQADTMGNMSYAYMQTHPLGVVSLNAPIGDLVSATIPQVPYGFVSGAFTLEATKGSPGSWYRGIRWGVAKKSQCAEINFGSYTLVRLVDGEGKAVGGNLQEFVDYMGEVPLLMWTGFKSPADREYVRKQLAVVDKPGR